MSPRTRRVTASEIGQYAYCARAWWLSTVKKLEPVNVEMLTRGQSVHERHGWQVILARGLNKLALAFLAGGALALLVWGVARLVM